jgi:signal transduction histidine kinase
MTSSSDLLPRLMSLAVHELRTPVTVVGGYLRMLLREQAGPLTEKQRKMLEEAERSCTRLNALVNEMSDFGKLEAGDVTLARQDVDIARLLVELATDMHEGEDRGVRLEVRGTDQPIVISGDRTRLSAALKALLQSALRERGEPGAIIAECSSIAGGDGTRYVLVAIGDEATLPTLTASADGHTPIFDVWRGGLGLALPVARQVIEGHGGRLWSTDGTQSRAASALRLPLRT